MIVLHGVFGGGILLCGNSAKRGDHCDVNGANVVEKTSITYSTNFIFVAVRGGDVSSSLVYCTFLPYFGLMCGCG